MKIEQIIEGLKAIAEDLNKHNIRWSVGASLLLYLEHYDVEVGDIDIVVHQEDYNLLLDMLKDYECTYQNPNEKYLTSHFFTLNIKGVDVDIMIGFKVVKDTMIYEYPFHIEKVIVLDNIKIYLASLDEWYTAYKAMNRIDKVLILQSNKKRN